MKQIYSAKCIVEGCNNIAMFNSNLCAIHRKEFKETGYEKAKSGLNKLKKFRP